MRKLLITLLSLTPLILSLFISCAGYDDYFDYRIDTLVVKKVDTVIVGDTSVPSEPREEKYMTNLNLTVQLGSFANQSYAVSFAETAKQNLNYETEIQVYDDKFCVIAGNFDTVKKAEAYLSYVKSKGYNQAYIRNK